MPINTLLIVIIILKCLLAILAKDVKDKKGIISEIEAISREIFPDMEVDIINEGVPSESDEY